MKFFTFSILNLVLLINLTAQLNWQWQSQTNITMAISNNAVCEGLVNNVPYIYSFAGIDTTKIYSGITNRSFRMNTITNVWEEITELPETNTKIAASANYVNGKIYIIGGYTVLPNGNEISSSKVHIYNTNLNIFEEDGPDIPIAIDDQVQCVYNDSLIFVVTGWSNSNNVNDVQIYNTYNNTWQVGTATPNTNNFKVFGASGNIIGDTIYYIGGARFGANFPLTNILRKGFINPTNPTEIDWTFETTNDAIAYRNACININDTIYWIGGSKTSYNFDGIAYNGSGGVEPSLQVLRYLPANGFLEVFENEAPAIMDLRGVAKTNDKLFLVGGMTNNQTVTNNVYSFVYNENFVGLNNFTTNKVAIYPNPVLNKFEIKLNNIKLVKIFDSKLNHIKSISKNNIINCSNLKNGIYFLEITDENDKIYFSKIVKSN